MTYVITVNHGMVATKETERSFFIKANSEQESYQLSKSHLRNCGNDGYEYIMNIL